MTTFRTLTATLALALSAGMAGAVSVDLSFDRTDLAPGDTFTVTLTTSDDVPAFGGFQTALSFDAAILEEVAASVNPIFTIADTTPGGIAGTDFGFVLDPSTAPSGALALGSVTFRALAAGTSAIVFAAPGVDGVLASPGGTAIVEGPLTAQATVTGPVTPPAPVVPLPASALLLLGALGGLGALRLRG